MVKAADTLKTTVEQYSAAGSQAFKDGVEKSLASMNDLNAQSKQNLEAIVAATTAAAKGAEALGAQTIAFSKKAMEDNVAAAKSLGAAKSVQEVVELQTAWFKSSLEGYIAEFNKATEIVSGSVKDTWTPLNARVTATVEKFQAAR
jgi:phasin family protein